MAQPVIVPKAEYSEWKNSAMTQALHEEILDTVNTCTHTILNRMEVDVGKDQYLKGYIAGLWVCLTWRPPFIEDALPKQENTGNASETAGT